MHERSLVVGGAAADEEFAVLEVLGFIAGLGFAGLTEQVGPDVCSLLLFAAGAGPVFSGSRGCLDA